MTAHSHTPGPWMTEPTQPGSVYCDDATGSIVATCNGFQYAPRPEAEKLANARLIAASPKLLAFAKSVADNIVLGGSEIGAQAREVIAEATQP